MPAIADAHVLIVATGGFEESELFVPRRMLRDKGARVSLASPSLDMIRATVRDEEREHPAVGKRRRDEQSLRDRDPPPPELQPRHDHISAGKRGGCK